MLDQQSELGELERNATEAREAIRKQVQTYNNCNWSCGLNDVGEKNCIHENVPLVLHSHSLSVKLENEFNKEYYHTKKKKNTATVSDGRNTGSCVLYSCSLLEHSRELLLMLNMPVKLSELSALHRSSASVSNSQSFISWFWHDAICTSLLCSYVFNTTNGYGPIKHVLSSKVDWLLN